MITINYTLPGFKLKETLKIKNWIKEVAILENKKAKDIAIIFCDDEYLLEKNNEFLKHDYYTDIITFQYSEGKLISGDLFISITRVKDNALELGKEFENELHRVIIHGILHLCDYKDKSKEDEKLMRTLEDKYLLMF